MEKKCHMLLQKLKEKQHGIVSSACEVMIQPWQVDL